LVKSNLLKRQELKKLIENSLASNSNENLICFINEHLDVLTDPYEGKPLPVSWEEIVEPKDPHQYGNLALTKFYDARPQNEIGLMDDWESIFELLEQEAKGLETAILGRACGISPNYFDPGKMGTYFQSANLVKQNLAQIKQLVREKPELQNQLEPAIEMLEIAASQNKGLYVRF